MTEIDDAALDALATKLRGRHGHDEAITSSELSSILSETAEASPKTRMAIKQLMRETDMTVLSGHAGYFVAEDDRDVAEYLQRLQERIDGIKERQRIVQENWHKQRDNDEGTAESTLSEEEIAQIEADPVLELSDFGVDNRQPATDGGVNVGESR